MATVSVNRMEEAEQIKAPEVQQAELPPASVELISEDAFKIELSAMNIEKMWDQAAPLQDGQGCISSPGGPSC